MTKQFNLLVDRFQATTFFSPIRKKRDIIALWMNSIKGFLANQPASSEQADAYLSIVVRSMSRLFCGSINGRKIFSIAFPFTVRMIDGELLFFSREGILIDSRTSSQILGLLDTDVLGASDLLGFLDPVLDAVEADAGIWLLFRELLLAEEAYVRYDWDEERANGRLHPLHHLDFGYSNSGTFKLGLQGAIDQTRLIEILDVEIDCDYVLPVSALDSVRVHRRGRE